MDMVGLVSQEKLKGWAHHGSRGDINGHMQDDILEEVEMEPESNTWDLDDELLARLEAREDMELGADQWNEDTFGDFAEEWVHEESRGVAKAELSSSEDWWSFVTSAKMLPTKRLQRQWVTEGAAAADQ